MPSPNSPMLYAIDLCDCELLADLASDCVTAAFVTALERAGASVVQVVSHVFPDVGLTSVVILRESHAVLHTWPETGTVHVDVFSCTARLNTVQVIDDLRRLLGARQVSIQEIARADGHRPD